MKKKNHGWCTWNALFLLLSLLQAHATEQFIYWFSITLKKKGKKGKKLFEPIFDGFSDLSIPIAICRRHHRWLLCSIEHFLWFIFNIYLSLSNIKIISQVAFFIISCPGMIKINIWCSPTGRRRRRNKSDLYWSNVYITVESAFKTSRRGFFFSKVLHTTATN